mmetsp:Transcript_4879/g.14897  ORF Transcript_4879/g.14897 Transcript_4879/m.14897 type:complete len:245 (+) Transcript_4879:1735-2469(+)
MCTQMRVHQTEGAVVQLEADRHTALIAHHAHDADAGRSRQRTVEHRHEVGAHVHAEQHAHQLLAEHHLVGAQLLQRAQARLFPGRSARRIAQQEGLRGQIQLLEAEREDGRRIQPLGQPAQHPLVEVVHRLAPVHVPRAQEEIELAALCELLGASLQLRLDPLLLDVDHLCLRHRLAALLCQRHQRVLRLASRHPILPPGSSAAGHTAIDCVRFASPAVRRRASPSGGRVGSQRGHGGRRLTGQ